MADAKDNSMWRRVNSSTIVITTTRVVDPRTDELVYVDQEPSEIKLSDKEKRKNLIQEPVTAKGHFRLPFTDDSVMENTELNGVPFDMIVLPGVSGLLMTGMTSVLATYPVSVPLAVLFALPGLFVGASALGMIVNTRVLFKLRKIEALNLRYFDQWLVSQGINISPKEVHETMDYIRLGHDKIQVAGTSQTLVKADERLGAYEVKKTKSSSERSREKAVRAKQYAQQYAIEDAARRRQKAEAKHSDFEAKRKQLCAAIITDHSAAVKTLGTFDSGIINLKPVRKELVRIEGRVEELKDFLIREVWQYKAILRELKTLKKDVKVASDILGTASWRQVDALNRKLVAAEQDVAARQPSTRQSGLSLSTEVNHV